MHSLVGDSTYKLKKDIEEKFYLMDIRAPNARSLKFL